MQTDVLIVGAGPTGLMLANQLARRGVRFTIIDRHSGPAQQTRAMAVHARTLEIYSKLGIIEQALALGARGNGANLWANGRWTARIPIGDIGKGQSPYPFVLMLGQDDNERILGDKLASFGGNVAWRTELISLEQRPNHVIATFKCPDGSTTKLEATWVAGCDGSKSAVRELNGIGFPGAPYEHTFFVADTEATGPMKPDELNGYLWRDGFHLFFPMRGKDRWRVIGILPKALRQRTDLTFEEVEPSIRQEAGAALSFKSCSWFSTYRIQHRAAERFQSGRCFLLGDAAHIHSPMGGQGMNTGLQDAYNLAWKLALVVQGRADSTLLDSYAEERMPVAKRLLETTDQAFLLFVSDTKLAALLRTQIIASYPKSSLSGTLPGVPKEAPMPGDRFPWLRLRFNTHGLVEDLFDKLDDRYFNLLVIGQTPSLPGALRAFSDVLRTYVITSDPINDAEFSRSKIAQPSFYLLRPDGHVGLCGADLETSTIERYLVEQSYLKTKFEHAERVKLKAG
jgi:2-polyprenyl-6-methoxyphenol hydroxylase-like FAD-dependent oxidoreductase